MNNINNILNSLRQKERRLIKKLTSPVKIQSFLDTCAYRAEEKASCPLNVLKERRAHCFDGATFAAMILRQLGHPPLLLNMFPNERDDEHILAVFKKNGGWGSIGKSNFVGLRYREPIHHTLRELMMSYFEQYYNVAGQKTLRSYTKPLNLSVFDRLDWMTDDKAMEVIGKRLDLLKRYPLLNKKMEKNLQKVDQRSYKAGLIGSDPKGLFKI